MRMRIGELPIDRLGDPRGLGGIGHPLDIPPDRALARIASLVEIVVVKQHLPFRVAQFRRRCLKDADQIEGPNRATVPVGEDGGLERDPLDIQTWPWRRAGLQSIPRPNRRVRRRRDALF